ncbi:transcription factor VIP1-like [Salvia hispanica]|uniref:transcription factor VIP1-like n=1 Tax=Salvia hispanica TaxID=49212 RepID=UPI002008FB70|nr:transcription factor VIP1-like [Salvia hispanica]
MFTGKPVNSGPYFPGRAELDQMPDTPTRRAQHRRAQSETQFRFLDLDEILLDDDVMVELNLDLPPSLLPPASDAAPLRSLSLDADFFDGLKVDAPPPPKHRHSNSMEGLSELALLDPKRAKRILANRQSAARSKERKTRYTSELERKVQTLQTEATTLSAQITVLQRDAGGLTAANKELKLKLQALQQQAELREALNDSLRNELQHLKIAAGQAPSPHYFANHQSQQQRLSSHNDAPE